MCSKTVSFVNIRRSAISVMDFVMHAEEEDSVDRLVGMVSESRFIKKIRELFGNVR